MSAASMKCALLGFPGSKWRIMARFESLFPAHYHYVSVFGGSATDLLYKQPSDIETYNDIDQTLHEFFKLLQNRHKFEQLADKIEYTPYSYQVFCGALKILKRRYSPALERAWAFFVAASQGNCTAHPCLLTPAQFSLQKRGRNGRINTRSLTPRPAYMKHRWANRMKRLYWAHHRLQGVRLLNCDWWDVIRECDDPNTFFYLDPPYLTRTDTRFYLHHFTEADHEELLDVLQFEVQGKVFVCGYDSDLYKERLKDWHHCTFETVSTLCVNGKSRRKRVEHVWTNYTP